jgi:hypothetical protein
MEKKQFLLTQDLLKKDKHNNNNNYNNNNNNSNGDETDLTSFKHLVSYCEKPIWYSFFFKIVILLSDHHQRSLICYDHFKIITAEER